jgi:hypothetical protein
MIGQSLTSWKNQQHKLRQKVQRFYMKKHVEVIDILIITIGKSRDIRDFGSEVIRF